MNSLSKKPLGPDGLNGEFKHLKIPIPSKNKEETLNCYISRPNIIMISKNDKNKKISLQIYIAH